MDQLWTKNIKVLFKRNRLKEFWPSKKYHFNENVNAITRFILYLGIILMLFKNDILFFILSLLIISIVGYIASKNQPISKYKSVIPDHQCPEMNKMIIKDCTMPTKNNPFANPMLRDDPNRPPACAYDNVKDQINDAFFSNFQQNPFDIFDKKHSQRQFFSVPNTTIPNDQEGFATWLYGGKNKKICKENNFVCTGTEAFG